jgi:hypothetical protein
MLRKMLNSLQTERILTFHRLRARLGSDHRLRDIVGKQRLLNFVVFNSDHILDQTLASFFEARVWAKIWSVL